MPKPTWLAMASVFGGENGALELIDLTERQRTTAELVQLPGAMR